jgi:hypothetical protein
MSDAPYKSNRGAPKKAIPSDDWHVSVDLDLSTHFRLKHMDTFTGKTRKGALSELVNRLLREEYNREKEAGHAQET